MKFSPTPTLSPPLSISLAAESLLPNPPCPIILQAKGAAVRIQMEGELNSASVAAWRDGWAERAGKSLITTLTPNAHLNPTRVSAGPLSNIPPPPRLRPPHKTEPHSLMCSSRIDHISFTPPIFTPPPLHLRYSLQPTAFPGAGRPASFVFAPLPARHFCSGHLYWVQQVPSLFSIKGPILSALLEPSSLYPRLHIYISNHLLRVEWATSPQIDPLL